MTPKQHSYVRCFGRAYEAVLFDMDGTLVDSRAVVKRVWAFWAASHGLDPTKILAVSHGRRTIDTIRQFALAGMNVDDEANKLEAIEAADNEGVLAIRGAREFIGGLSRNQWAVVTSAGRNLATQRLRAAGLPIPEVLVCAEDVERGKPNPQGYKLAADLLGKSITRCLVFEDAPAGIQAGIEAGCDVVAIKAAQPFPFTTPCRAILDFTSPDLRDV